MDKKIEGGLGIVMVFILGISTANVMGIIGSGAKNETKTPEFECIRIESVFENNIYIRNCGGKKLEKTDISVYIENDKVEYMLKEAIDVNHVGVLELNTGSNPCKPIQVKVVTGGVSDSQITDFCS